MGNRNASFDRGWFDLSVGSMPGSMFPDNLSRRSHPVARDWVHDVADGRGTQLLVVDGGDAVERSSVAIWALELLEDDLAIAGEDQPGADAFYWTVAGYGKDQHKRRWLLDMAKGTRGDDTVLQDLYEFERLLSRGESSPVLLLDRLDVGNLWASDMGLLYDMVSARLAQVDTATIITVTSAESPTSDSYAKAWSDLFFSSQCTLAEVRED